MTKFLFTMFPANDLGLPTRLLPIARELANRDHDVAVFNPAPAPTKLIADAGFINLPMPPRPMPPPTLDDEQVASAWDVDQLFAGVCVDQDYVCAAIALHVDLIRDYAPDVVVDSFGPFTCLAARILKIPLATVLQGNFHPASDGFLWWKGKRPDGLPSAAPAINIASAEYGQPPVARCVDLLAGDLSLIVGTPESDPLPATANVTYVGQIIWQRGNAELPDWISSMNREKPLVWVYSGNPRYGTAHGAADSIVVIRAAIAALRDAPMNVVLTTGYQELPDEFGALPANFRNAAYLPGLAMAERCDLMVHHGGHSSVMTGLSVGKPAVIIPTITERESNARRLVALGAGEIVMPVVGSDGEKQIDVADFAAKVTRVLTDPNYRQSARRIADSMRQYGGAKQAAQKIEQFAAANQQSATV
jgi:UDP:flavonoid glycosyltransferase YjiC (YdhE family)